MNSLDNFANFNYSKFNIGRVVLHRETRDLGHIVGFDQARNDHGYETILKVLWSDGEVRSIPPGNVWIFT